MTTGNAAVIDYEKLSQALLMQGVKGMSNTQDKRREAYQASFKAISTVTSIYAHGSGGLYSMPGLSKPVFSAMLLPDTGLASRLPTRASRDQNPIYGIFTGVTATTGSEPADACADPPTAGLSKLCMHTFVFSRFSRQTRAFDIDRSGLITNRGEFLDLELMNNPFDVSPQNPGVPTLPTSAADVLRSESAKAVFELGVSMARDSARELYTGNPANNSGARQYYYGLDILINTGYRDAESGTACPAADSIVQSFNNGRIDLAPTSIVTVITYMMRNLRYIAQRVGLDPATWALTMRFGAFYELSQVWPLAYYTTGNTIQTAAQPIVNDGRGLIEFRDDMRNNNYLMIDGQKVPVIIDEAITETSPAPGIFSSTIYFVPLTVLGGVPVTFFEHINYDGPMGALEMAQVMAPDGSYSTSDGGRFLWHRKPPANFCVQMVAKTQPRLMLLTPHIAARLTNVRYAPYLHERGSFTDDGYFANGGRTDRLGYPPSLFGPTA